MSYFNPQAASYATACKKAADAALLDATRAMQDVLTLALKAQRCNLRVTLLEQGVSLADLENRLEREWEKAGWPPTSTPPTSSTGATPPSPSPGT